MVATKVLSGPTILYNETVTLSIGKFVIESFKTPYIIFLFILVLLIIAKSIFTGATSEIVNGVSIDKYFPSLTAAIV